MRKTKARGWNVPNSSSVPTPALRLATVTLGVALAMTAGAARAADDGDEKPFSDKIVDSIKTTIRGGTSIDDGTIQYRERSPLVVPPRLDLPPPDTSSKTAKAVNWPKDPDDGRRRTTAKKKSKPGILDTILDPLLPSKPREGGSASAAADEPTGPPPPPRPDNETAKNDPVYDRGGSALKASGINFNLFGTKTESAQFGSEPTRESLTQPPAGYQTPSPNFAYGVGPNDKNEPHPDDVARARRTQQ
jgi:hypothetical protein